DDRHADGAKHPPGRARLQCLGGERGRRVSRGRLIWRPGRAAKRAQRAAAREAGGGRRLIDGGVKGIAMTVVSSSPRADWPLTRAFELGCVALCMAQAMYLATALVQGQWLADPSGQPIAIDFVNVWAAGRQALAGQPAAVYEVALQKAAEVAAVGHDFEGRYPWLYPPSFLFVAVSLALLPYVMAAAGLRGADVSSLSDGGAGDCSPSRRHPPGVRLSWPAGQCGRGPEWIPERCAAGRGAFAPAGKPGDGRLPDRVARVQAASRDSASPRAR